MHPDESEHPCRAILGDADALAALLERYGPAIPGSDLNTRPG